MIKITKPSLPPDILSSTGVTKCASMCQDFILHMDEYRQGKRQFTFDASIYGHETVKQALIIAQHSKCCFCERKVGADGDVEHFRPKAGVRDSKSSKLLKPGYYWLAYNWDNLLLCCSACNQRHKRNLFPLVDSSKRAKRYIDKIEDEEPLFINPAHKDPEQYISFRDHIVYEVKGNRFAKHTIKALGLNRDILKEVRLEKLMVIISMRKILDSRDRLYEMDRLNETEDGRELIQMAETYLAACVLDTFEFAGMARAAAKQDFRLCTP